MFAERFRLGRAALALAGVGLLPTCLSVRDEVRPEANACASCHGSAEGTGDALLESAPPRDLMGNTSRDYPGVGAHRAHLDASATHAGVACSECHSVPEATDSPGHADSPTPAELSFGLLARASGHVPSYDALARRCADTYCHGALSPVWTEPDERCASCHGLPPAAPHPQSERCSACHATVLDAEQRFVDPARHVDGRVDLSPIACESCHGSAESAAPPPALAGQTQTDERGVGAHRAHQVGGAQGRALACSECHPVPGSAPPFTHPEGGEALVSFVGVARAGERAPAWDAEPGACSNTWCHDPSGRAGEGVSWTGGGPLACAACHGMPPAAPHPQVEDCGLCHAEVAGRGAVISNAARHVDGIVDVSMPSACTGCHSSGAADAGGSGVGPNAAPDLGAHAAHLAPDGPARPVPCVECHLVPSQVLAPGHVDTSAPAEVRFSGVATAFEARPLFDAGTCAQTYCHGDSFIGGRPSGGVDTQPSWSATSGALTCQSCHGLPPPPPHPTPADDCSGCHRNVDAARQFVARETHIDGVVTFFLP